jgi:hypothetical protein
MWITPSRDKTLAELMAGDSIHGGGSISPYLVQPPVNQWLVALNQISPEIRDYIRRKKSDEIANQLMNMEQPPRAQAIGYDQGAPATQPFTGGAAQFKLRNLYQDYIDKQQEDQVKSAQEERKARLDEANIARLNAPGDPRYSVQLPDGRTVNVTGNEAAQYYRPRANQANADSIEKIDQDAHAWTGHRLHELINSTDARNNPDGSATITLADGKTTATLTADALRNIRERYARLQGGQSNPALQAFQQAQQTPLPAPDLPPVTAPEPTSAPPLPQTRIITKDGHHYEVDDVNKKVIRQID